MNKRKTILAVILLLSSLLSAQTVPVMAFEKEPNPNELYAKSAVLLDAGSGRVLYEKNGNEILPMASTTKIMTCILVLENCEMNEQVTVSAYAASMPKVRLNLNRGDSTSVEDLLYSMMLESHNDSAVALAEYVGEKISGTWITKTEASSRSVEDSKKLVAEFVTLMNCKAREIGCFDTYFITPNGLDASETVYGESGKEEKEHVTTAEDLAKILAYCTVYSAKKDLFLGITATEEHMVQTGSKKVVCYNHNSLQKMFPGVVSGKTGFTNKAGYCYVGEVKNGERIFVVALLACGWPGNRNYKWSDAKKLFRYGLDRYHWENYRDGKGLAVEESFPQIPVNLSKSCRLGEQTFISPKIKDALTGEGMLLREDEKIRKEIRMVKQLEAPVRENQVVGEIRYLCGDRVCGREEIIVGCNLERQDIKWCFREILKMYFLLEKR